jgi:hypothetical protein
VALITEIMDEIANQLNDVLGVTALGNEAFSIAARLNLSAAEPAIDIYPAFEFVTNTARGFDQVEGELNFVVRARVNGDAYGRQDLLLTLMDANHDNCVAHALEDDQTLNGKASSVEVDGPTGYTQYADAGGSMSHIGCEWRVTVVRALS